MSNITGSYTISGGNITLSVPSPAYLLQTSSGPVSLTDQASSLLIVPNGSVGALVGITEDGTANAAQIVIDQPATGFNSFKVDTTAAAGATAYGFLAASAQSLSTLTIKGTDASHSAIFWINAEGTAVGAQMGSGAFNNGGLFEVDASNTTNGAAIGVVVTGTGSVNNTFQIHVQARTAVGVSFANASGSSFTNSANAIMQVDKLAGGSSTGIAFGGAYASGQWLTITNAGDLHADTAIQALTSGVSSTPIVHLTNTGTIEGDIHLGIGPSALHGAGSQVVNNGQITGNVYLDTNGDDVYDSSQGGGLATAVYLGSGSDTVHLGSAGGVVHAGAGAATITGTTGAMKVYSGTGAETVTGSSAGDTFAFGPGLGADVVTNFSDAQGDKIDLSAFGVIHTLSDVLALASQQGANTVITVGGGSITLDGVSLSSLTAADFVLPTLVTGTAANNFTASFQGVVRQYTVGVGGGTVTGGPENANDTLVNIHHIKFVDGYLDYAAADPAGQVYRLYEATLNRAPDQEGLTSWVNALNSGTSLQSVANGFVASPEFQATYGANLTNDGFVTLLYHNVLHRDPDQAGLTNWVNAMNGGETRAQVVLGFSESPEDINASAFAVGQGLWVGDAAAAQVARLYDTVFARLPDSSGLINWTHSLESGTSLQTVANGFVAAPEFQQTYGANLSNNDFVTLLYHNVLHRDPDQAGLTNWVNAMNGGETRAQVVIGFSESPEHIANTAAHIDSGIWIV